jgi:hypothetical protein
MEITRLEMVSFTFRFKVKRDRNAGGTGAKSERETLLCKTHRFGRLKKAAAISAAAGCQEWQHHFAVSR